MADATRSPKTGFRLSPDDPNTERTEYTPSFDLRDKPPIGGKTVHHEKNLAS